MSVTLLKIGFQTGSITQLAVASQNVLKIQSGSDNFQKIGFNLSIIQGHHHNNLSIIQGHHHNITPICYTQRGVTTQRQKQKKVHRFADKLVVPPQKA